MGFESMPNPFKPLTPEEKSKLSDKELSDHVHDETREAVVGKTLWPEEEKESEAPKEVESRWSEEPEEKPAPKVESLWPEDQEKK